MNDIILIPAIVVADGQPDIGLKRERDSRTSMDFFCTAGECRSSTGDDGVVTLARARRRIERQSEPRLQRGALTVIWPRCLNHGKESAPSALMVASVPLE
jgi:hypothetical protein